MAFRRVIGIEKVYTSGAISRRISCMMRNEEKLYAKSNGISSERRKSDSNSGISSEKDLAERGSNLRAGTVKAVTVWAYIRITYVDASIFKQSGS